MSQSDLGGVSKGFHLVDGYAYMLSRNFAASSRLNLQFFLWYESLQFNLHPSIPFSPSAIEPATKSPLRIADVATGTAIWLFSLAKSLPATAILDGYDISLDNAPCSGWLPSNVTLSTLDIFDVPPTELLNQFDVVHVRLLVLVVRNSDPRPIIRTLRSMLKPGGFLQWDDLDYPGTHVARPAGIASEATPGLNRLREFVYSAGRHDWVLALDKALAEEGFDVVAKDQYKDDVSLTKANGDQHMLTMEEFVGRLEGEGKAEDAEKVRKMMVDVGRETDAGAALSMPRMVVVGKKRGH